MANFWKKSYINLRNGQLDSPMLEDDDQTSKGKCYKSFLSAIYELS